ncbi:hypothetical protein MGG_15095 [Pyricularia oryzae 70-15]|uniref:Uncharacterized protein n=3 Tax=Pyricularia oryzae TaxID=318829 RepID=G4MVW9_PYRO7|nr:uncharacterized protein MGG_15095 [Pyricularia oryzae 70-15]EHA55837.1 hypothetical protein MGG_15095 [Pyricularia oryzae 70-15]ELQ40795.1 hypothetical protein OOU_Y34scaffold00355g4 [Pyricularia oryzae Y34]
MDTQVLVKGHCHPAPHIDSPHGPLRQRRKFQGRNAWFSCASCWAILRWEAVNLRGLNDVTVDASPAVEVPTPTIGYASRHYQDFMFFNTDVQTSSSSAMLSRLDSTLSSLEASGFAPILAMCKLSVRRISSRSLSFPSHYKKLRHGTIARSEPMEPYAQPSPMSFCPAGACVMMVLDINNCVRGQIVPIKDDRCDRTSLNGPWRAPLGNILSDN